MAYRPRKLLQSYFHYPLPGERLFDTSALGTGRAEFLREGRRERLERVRLGAGDSRPALAGVPAGTTSLYPSASPACARRAAFPVARPCRRFRFQSLVAGEFSFPVRRGEAEEREHPAAIAILVAARAAGIGQPETAATFQPRGLEGWQIEPRHAVPAARAPQEDAPVYPEPVRDRRPFRRQGPPRDPDAHPPAIARGEGVPLADPLVVERLSPQDECAFGDAHPPPAPP